MKVVWTEPQWLIPGGVMLALIGAGLFLSYWRKTSMPVGVRWLAGSLKWIGFAMLLGFILQPVKVTTFNRPGTNHWAVLLDNSASMTLKDQDDGKSRADRLNEIIPTTEAWRKQLEKDFIVDFHTFDRRLGRHAENEPLRFDGTASALGRALAEVRDRYQGRPLAGILVITDGTPTDAAEAEFPPPGLPPVFPLVIAPEKPLIDLAVSTASAQATLFEDAPVLVDATISTHGAEGKAIFATVRETSGKVLERRTQRVSKPGEMWNVRFQVKPEAVGTAFFEVEVGLENPAETTEATMENNRRLIAANRDTGPYRVLYVAGRPNYEHKFLQRALEADPEVRMTSLIRIARREAKFEYLGRQGESSNPLYRGFGSQEEAERFDEPVFIRLGTQDAAELAEGFPKTPAGLFPFDAVILDDVEAAFFDREQQRLLQRFVSERGGSVVMLGGAESLDTGGYHGTPVGEMLPVYLDPVTPPGSPLTGKFVLTREGLLEPWARLRETDGKEVERIDRMPEFQNIHRLAGLRPGAMAIGKLELAEGASPGLATRRYGRGRTAVLAVSDWWSWGLRDAESHQDLDKSWRQFVRWSLADVPRPLSLKSESAADGQLVTAEMLGEDFRPSDASGMAMRVRLPDGNWSQLSPIPHPERPGVQQTTRRTDDPGTYLAEATARRPGGKSTVTTGWVSNPLQDEYLAIQPDLDAMARLADQTYGKVITRSGLAAFVESLKNLPVPVKETRTEPFWNSPLWLLAALVCFVGEWSLRRWKRLT